MNINEEIMKLAKEIEAKEDFDKKGEENRKEALKLIDKLSKKVKSIKIKNWGDTGSLGHVRDVMEEINKFLGI